MFAESGARRRPDRRSDTSAHRHHAQRARGRPSGVAREAVRAGTRRRQSGRQTRKAKRAWPCRSPTGVDSCRSCSTLRSDLADGKYGTVHFLVCSQWDEAPPPLSFRNDSGGIYIDMGVHEVDQTRWLLGQDFTDVKAHPFPTTEDPGAENDVDSAQALVMLSGGTSTVISLGRFYEGGDIVSIELYGIEGSHPFRRGLAGNRGRTAVACSEIAGRGVRPACTRGSAGRCDR